MNDSEPLAVRVGELLTVTRAAMDQHRAEFGNRVPLFLEAVSRSLIEARPEIEEFNRIHAPKFNPFDYIRPDENPLSDILADLLNPNGHHGQGDRFLRHFLKRIGKDRETWPRVKIIREAATGHLANSRRRIDIEIDFGNFGVGIENKPWAEDQYKQVADYFTHLNRKYGERFVLVYLSGNGEGPSSQSVSAAVLKARETNRQYRLICYRPDLVKWLNECEAECKSDAVQWFLRQFRTYIQEQFAEAEPEVSDEPA